MADVVPADEVERTTGSSSLSERAAGAAAATRAPTSTVAATPVATSTAAVTLSLVAPPPTSSTSVVVPPLSWAPTAVKTTPMHKTTAAADATCNADAIVVVILTAPAASPPVVTPPASADSAPHPPEAAAAADGITTDDAMDVVPPTATVASSWVVPSPAPADPKQRAQKDDLVAKNKTRKTKTTESGKMPAAKTGPAATASATTDKTDAESGKAGATGKGAAGLPPSRSAPPASTRGLSALPPRGAARGELAVPSGAAAPPAPPRCGSAARTGPAPAGGPPPHRRAPVSAALATAPAPTKVALATPTPGSAAGSKTLAEPTAFAVEATVASARPRDGRRRLPSASTATATGARAVDPRPTLPRGVGALAPVPLPDASARGSIGRHTGELAFSPPAISEEGGLDGGPTDSDSLVDATPASPPSPPPAAAAPPAHQPGVVALAEAVALRVASAARCRRAATDPPVASAPADSTSALSAAAAPVGSRRKALPTPTTSPAGTHKVPPRHVPDLRSPVYSRQNGRGAATVLRPRGAVDSAAGDGRCVCCRERADGAPGGRLRPTRESGARQGATGPASRAVPPLCRGPPGDGARPEACAVPEMRAAIPVAETPLRLDDAGCARSQVQGWRLDAGGRRRATTVVGASAPSGRRVSERGGRAGRGDCADRRPCAATSFHDAAPTDAAVCTAAPAHATAAPDATVAGIGGAAGP